MRNCSSQDCHFASAEYVGAPESIQGLLRVADEKQIVLPTGENLAEDFVLDRVRILEFID